MNQDNNKIVTREDKDEEYIEKKDGERWELVMMDLLIFLLGTAFGVGAHAFTVDVKTAHLEGMTVGFSIDLIHDGMVLIFILVLLRVYLQL